MQLPACCVSSCSQICPSQGSLSSGSPNYSPPDLEGCLQGCLPYVSASCPGVLTAVRSNGASPMMQRANGACAHDACDGAALMQGSASGGYCRNPSPAPRGAVGARSS